MGDVWSHSMRDFWYFQGDMVGYDVVGIIDKYTSLDSADPRTQAFSVALREDWEDSDDDLRLEVFGPHFDDEVLSDCIDLYDAAMAMKLGYIL